MRSETEIREIIRLLKMAIPHCDGIAFTNGTACAEALSWALDEKSGFDVIVKAMREDWKEVQAIERANRQ